MPLPRALFGSIATVLITGGLAWYALADDATAVGSTFVVNDISDAGDGTCDATCTLRDAIIAANSDTLATIAFNIPGCPPACTIMVVSELPYITATGTVLDGTTEPDYSNTPVIIIDGSLTPFGDGLLGFAAGVIVRGVVVQNFSGNGVNFNFNPFDGRRLESSIVRDNGSYGVALNGSDIAVVDSVISGNGSDGVAANFAGTGTGLLIAGNEITNNARTGLTYSFVDVTITDNIISGNQDGVTSGGGGGGTIVATGNTVSANRGAGLSIVGDPAVVSDNVAQDNWRSGIDVSHGVAVVADNLVSGNGFPGGIAGAGNGGPGSGLVVGGSGQKIVAGNIVTGNALHGIRVASNGHIIGGESPADANIVSGNGGAGVSVDEGETGNVIQRNSIHDNGGLGIDLQPDGLTPNDPLDNDDGANGLQNFPELDSALAGSLTVEGELNSAANRQYRIEFFSVDGCDASGFGEGETFVGSINVLTNPGGRADIEYNTVQNVPAGRSITSTATDLVTNETSEFSQCVVVTGFATPTPTPSPSATLAPTPTPSATAPSSASPTSPPSITPTPTGGPSLLQGDVDCSGEVDPIDSLKVLRHDAGLNVDREAGCPEMGIAVPAGGAPPVWGDVDCNGDVGPIDSLKLLRHDAGLGVDQEEGCTDIGQAVN